MSRVDSCKQSNVSKAGVGSSHSSSQDFLRFFFFYCFSSRSWLCLYKPCLLLSLVLSEFHVEHGPSYSAPATLALQRSKHVPQSVDLSFLLMLSETISLHQKGLSSFSRYYAFVILWLSVPPSFVMLPHTHTPCTHTRCTHTYIC